MYYIGKLVVNVLMCLQVAQAAARILGIPLNIIKIKPTNVLSSPNSETTGGSMTSELNVMAVINACNELNDRIDPVRRSMSGEPTWKEVIAKCFEERVDLSAKALYDVNTYTPYSNHPLPSQPHLQPLPLHSPYTPPTLPHHSNHSLITPPTTFIMSVSFSVSM